MVKKTKNSSASLTAHFPAHTTLDRFDTASGRLCRLTMTKSSVKGSVSSSHVLYVEASPDLVGFLRQQLCHVTVAGKILAGVADNVQTLNLDLHILLQVTQF